MGELVARRVESKESLENPGDFFIERRDDAPNKANFYYRCPCGKHDGRHVFDSGKTFELIYIAIGNKLDGYWLWDGNEDAPTLAPSIWSKTEYGGCGWHGFLTKGRWTNV